MQKTNDSLTKDNLALADKVDDLERKVVQMEEKSEQLKREREEKSLQHKRQLMELEQKHLGDIQTQQSTSEQDYQQMKHQVVQQAETIDMKQQQIQMLHV